jgi:hypothetical protein
VTQAEAYELLGGHPGCTREELTRAYHRKVSEWHPDKLEGMAAELKEYANRELARINEAHEKLASTGLGRPAETPFVPKQVVPQRSNEELRKQLEEITRQIEEANKILEEQMEKLHSRSRV